MLTHCEGTAAGGKKQRLALFWRSLVRVDFGWRQKGERAPERSLTEWVSSCRVASTPGRAGHVCSFAAALRFDSPDSPKLRRSSSPPKSARSLLGSDAVCPSWRSVHAAHANDHSAKTTQRTRIMFNYTHTRCKKL